MMGIKEERLCTHKFGHLSEVNGAHNHLPCFVCVACLIIKIATPRIIKVVPGRCTITLCMRMGGKSWRTAAYESIISYILKFHQVRTNYLCTSHCMALKPLWAIVNDILALRAQFAWSRVVKFHDGLVILLCYPGYIINTYRTRWIGICYVSKTIVSSYICNHQEVTWGRCTKLKPSAFKPCHVLCQLNLGLNNIDGVKAVFLERTFRVS